MIISTDKNVYEPAEDSYLLINALRCHDLAGMDVLDVGCGTGTVGLHAAAQGAVVTLVDNNPHALRLCKENAEKNKLVVQVVESDLFSNVTSVFDIIVCNPPYLPDDPREEEDYITRSLAGGRHGYEWTVAFLRQAREHLQPNGVVLFVASSLSKPPVLERHIAEQGFDFTVVQKQGVGLGETLLVYACTFIEPLKKLRKKGMSDIALHARGKRGLVFTGKYLDKTVAIKCKRPSSEVYDVTHEATLLRELNASDIGPRYVLHTDDALVMDFVEGTLFDEYIKGSVDERTLRFLLDQCLLLDSLDIDKKEMVRPLKNALVTSDGNVVLIDFERSRKSDRPHNLSQCAQFFCQRFSFSSESREEIKRAVQLYKADYDRRKGDAVVDLILTTFKNE